MTPVNDTLIALDVGEKRTGVATAKIQSGIASPLTTLTNPETFYQDIIQIISDSRTATLVVGLPRNNNGDDTAQTVFVRNFIHKLQPKLSVPVMFHDEAGTSKKAEQELHAKRKSYSKADVDALAATYILQSYIDETGRMVS